MNRDSCSLLMMSRPEIDRAFARFKRTGEPDALARVFDGCAHELLRLAVHLVHDLDVAEDLVQATFLAAIEDAKSFDPERAVLPWLTGILVNRARLARRSQARAPDPDRLRRRHAPSPMADAERVELDEALEKAIAALPEPYRPVLGLHLRHGLSAAEIALSLERSPGTVRSQISRGLELLRRALPAGLAGALAVDVASASPILTAARAAVLEHAARCATTSSAVATSLIHGVVLMKKVVLAAAVIALALGAAWMSGVFDDAQVAVAPAETLAHADTGKLTEAAPGPRRETVVTRRVPAQPVSETGKPPTFPAARPEGGVRGVVIGDNDEPVAGAEVKLRSTPGSLPFGLEISDDRSISEKAKTAADGRFEFAKIPAGPYRIQATKAGARVGKWLNIGARTERLFLQMEAASAPPRVAVFVVGSGDIPVAGASVELYGSDDRRVSKDAPLQTAETDEHGRCTLAGRIDGVLIARTPAGARGMAPFLWTHAVHFGVTIRVGPPGRLVVRLPRLSQQDLAAVRPRIHALTGPNNGYWWTYGRSFEGKRVADAFEFDDLPAGPYTVTLDGVGGPVAWRIATVERDVAKQVKPPSVDVGAGATTTLALETRRSGRITGLVRDSRDRPVAGARVFATLVPSTGNYTDGVVLYGAHVWRLDSDQRLASRHPFTHIETRTGPDGRYVLSGLQPGKQRVEVFAPRLSYDCREGVDVADEATVSLEHRLTEAGVLQGAVSWVTYLGVVPEGKDEPVMLAIIRGDNFTFPGLAPGRYAIGAFHSDQEIGWRKLGDAVVTAGRTTWVDLRERKRDVELSGVLMDANGPVADARVGITYATEVTAGDGSFTIGRDFPIRVRGGFSVAHLKVHVGGLEFVFPFEQAAAGASHWHETFRLGDHTLRVRTLDASGHPVAASVRVTRDASTREHEVEVSGDLHTRQSAPLVLRRLFPGRYTFDAEFANGYRAVQKVKVPADTDVVLREAVTGTIVVTARSPSGLPLIGCRVFCLTWTGEGPAPETEEAFRKSAVGRYGSTNAEGVVKLGGVRTGTVLVQAYRGIFARVKLVGRCELKRGATVTMSVTID